MRKTIHILLWSLFFLYCLFMVYLLFLSRPLQLEYSIRDFFRGNSNFIPFRTIFEYIERYRNGFRAAAFINLVGNLFAFFPLGIFLPCLFKSQRCLSRFFLTVFAIIVLVEITQLFLRAGVIDIDDVIFNVFGAVVSFGLVAIPSVRNVLKKLHLYF